MKKHKIKQIGEGSNAYTVFKNPNEKLKNEIANIRELELHINKIHILY